MDLELRRLLARRGDDLPHLRGLLAGSGSPPPASFASRICTVLVGIAVRRGDSWEHIPGLLRVDRPEEPADEPPG
jgi:hypothetical protein